MRLTEQQMRETVARVGYRNPKHAEIILQRALAGDGAMRFVIYQHWAQQTNRTVAERAQDRDEALAAYKAKAHAG